MNQRPFSSRQASGGTLVAVGFLLIVFAIVRFNSIASTFDRANGQADELALLAVICGLPALGYGMRLLSGDDLFSRLRPSLLSLLAAVLPFYLFDQATKWWIVRNFFPFEERIVSPGFFFLVNWQNTGAAFSMGTGNNTFFIALSAAAFIGLVVFYRRGAFPDACSRWAVVLLLAGILGNLTDRLVHGHVVDFLLFDLHVRFAHPFAAFNIADSCICIAVGLFILGSFVGKKSTAIE